MVFTYYQLINKNDVFVAEICAKELTTKKFHLRLFALDVYHVLENTKVVYPVVYATDVELAEEVSINSFNMEGIIKDTVNNREYYDNLPIVVPYCNKSRYGTSDYYSTSIAEDVLRYEALTCVCGIYDIEKVDKEKWIIRRNGLEIFNFNPEEFLKYYNPDYDGGDVDCYIGDGIIVSHMPESIYGTDRLAINYLAHRLNFIGKLWCIEHGSKPAKDDLLPEE